MANSHYAGAVDDGDVRLGDPLPMNVYYRIEPTDDSAEAPALEIGGARLGDDLVSTAPAVVVAREAAAESLARNAAPLDALDLSQLGLPPSRRRGALGWGAATSIAMHGAFVLAALLWSQSQTERAPEPLAVEIVVERAADPTPPAPDPQTAPVSPPAAETPPSAEPPPPDPSPAPSPAPTEEPTPVASPEPIPSSQPTAEPTPVATPEPTPVPSPSPGPTPIATPQPTPPPVAKPLALKPAPAPRKIEHAAQTPARPKAAPKATATTAAPPGEARLARAPAAASSASVGEYRDAVYARIRSHQRFPEAARDSGAHGTAELTFSLDEAGQLRSVSVIKSSGDAQLDVDALATVRHSAPFGPPPPGAPRDYAVKLRYQLQ